MLTRISAPLVEPITLAEVKAALAVIGSADDDLLQRLITAAVASFDGADGKLARPLIEQRWRLSMDRFPVGVIRLPLPPVISVETISYVDTSSEDQEIDPSEYSVSGLGSTDHAIISPVSRWPTGTAVAIEFTAGFGDDPEDVPQDVRDALIATVGSRFAWREASILAQGSLSENPEVADAVDRWRVRGFG
ncbi:hypothetical protein [Mesorhizobium sp. IMUNJ 23232]|uniref:head-tail connector protein n=1 Tax=Mesorhizobium sp. IMUNJ 23232 TaxID=3376064 RepID=UPI0037A98A3F